MNAEKSHRRNWITRRATRLLGMGCPMKQCRVIAANEWKAGLRDITHAPDFAAAHNHVFNKLMDAARQ